ncbi:hypothetical protein F2Q69_00020747 [Brassica cretica]|uniref:RNase H type-1 domain-containing protein n=1 Tax=Brassica cretica TaxID=69181 RepID=A0A8S9Q4T2_BRACR|nr:hypothetical protein F2Q69_00020747 [Brassica cretica]
MIDGSSKSTAQFSGYGWVWLDSLGKVQLMVSFGTDCKDLIAMINELHAWPSFETELERIETLKICFLDFKITHIPRTQNQISDFLPRTARSFHRVVLYFIGCSIPVWLRFSNLKFCETCTVISSLRRERDEESEGEFMDLGFSSLPLAMTSNKTERTQKLLKETVLLIDHGDELSLVSIQGKARSRRSAGKKQVIHKWINNMPYQKSLGPIFDALHSGVTKNELGIRRSRGSASHQPITPQPEHHLLDQRSLMYSS